MAVAFDATSNSGLVTSASGASWSHTCTGSNLALFVGGGSRSGALDNTSSVTYNSVAMTEQWDNTIGSFHCSGHTLVNPSTGANTVAVTLAGTEDEIYFGAVSATGVDQTTPFGTAATDQSATGTTGSVTVGSVASGDLVVDAIVSSTSAAALAAGANQTERWAIEGGCGGSTQAGSDGGVMSWTWEFDGFSMGAIAFKELAATGLGIAAIIQNYRHMGLH